MNTQQQQAIITRECSVFPEGSEYLASRACLRLLNDGAPFVTAMKFQNGSWQVFRGNKVRAQLGSSPWRERVVIYGFRQDHWTVIDAGKILALMREH